MERRRDRRTALTLRRRGGSGALSAAAVALSVLPSAAGAQEGGWRLAGVLVTEGSGTPIEGAVVALLDAGREVRDQALSTGQGAFTLVVEDPGAYAVRVERIGYGTWTSDAVRVSGAGPPPTLLLQVPVLAIPLPELVATEQTDCPTTPEERSEAFALYESVLPALASSSSTEDLGRLRMRLVRPARKWNGGMYLPISDTLEALVPRSFENASPSFLERYGYAEAPNDSVTTFYAPDGDAIASPGFLATHCLRPVDGDEAGRLDWASSPDQVGRPSTWMGWFG